MIEAWRRHYNEVRPHSSLGYLTPAAFARPVRRSFVRPDTADQYVVGRREGPAGQIPPIA